MTVLVDTCVWSAFLRRDRPKRDVLASEVERLVRADAIQMLGAIRQELLSGVQPQERFEQLRQYLRFFPNLVTDAEDDENAAAYYNLCRRQGVQGTATDMLICAVSVRHGLRILTTDRDFESYAKHVPIVLHQVRGRR